jgi:hypothetical protein
MKITELQINKTYRRKSWNFDGYIFFNKASNLTYFCNGEQEPILANYELLTSDDWVEHHISDNDKLKTIEKYCKKIVEDYDCLEIKKTLLEPILKIIG